MLLTGVHACAAEVGMLYLTFFTIRLPCCITLESACAILATALRSAVMS